MAVRRGMGRASYYARSLRNQMQYSTSFSSYIDLAPEIGQSWLLIPVFQLLIYAIFLTFQLCSWEMLATTSYVLNIAKRGCPLTKHGMSRVKEIKNSSQTLLEIS
jgi:hypothetical protein